MFLYDLQSSIEEEEEWSGGSMKQALSRGIVRKFRTSLKEMKWGLLESPMRRVDDK